MDDLPVGRKRLHLQGLVQGIGLRPLAYNLAQQMGLGGWVSNTPAGAVIEIEGEPAALEAFPAELTKSLPAIAQVLDWQEEVLAPQGEGDFCIRPSLIQETRSSIFCPDLAFCPQCRREFLDKNNRRYRYPFIGCPSCGPRFTVISELPYDRVRSSMAAFDMCPVCQEEYNNPADRRFHSQLNCCPDCGPQLQLWKGKTRVDDVDPLKEAIRQLQAGRIVAVKGLGGFHLAVDAAYSKGIARLRKRKARPDKPLAIMSTDLTKAAWFCQIPSQATELLQSSAAPIVLLPKQYFQILAKELAPQNHTLGVMLPYTPLHYLLSEPFLALVLTSGNVCDEPLVTDNKEALNRLSKIADYILLHDRDIQQPCDDSVVNPIASQTIFMRRSRGFQKPLNFSAGLFPKEWPEKEGLSARIEKSVFDFAAKGDGAQMTSGSATLDTDWESTPILACGGELKNTFAINYGQQILVSQHLGDLKSKRAYEAYQQAITHTKRLLRVEPELVVHDLHPDYLSTQYAKASGYPSVGVQHHHAHVVSVMGEYGLQGSVIGVAWDGTGYGEDGHLWGGEFLIADYAGYQRRAHFAYLPLPGGEAAIRQSWRVGLSLLYRDCPEKIEALTFPEAKDGVLQMLEKDFNCPRSSSCGRLFDGIAAILGLCSEAGYEGQAAVALQMAAQQVQDAQLYSYHLQEEDSIIINPASLVVACLDELKQGIGVDIIARRFHNTLAEIILQVCCRLREESGLNQVVLSGGVFQNELLVELALSQLAANAFEVYLPRRFPPNDGGLSLGQLLVAYAQQGEV